MDDEKFAALIAELRSRGIKVARVGDVLNVSLLDFVGLIGGETFTSQQQEAFEIFSQLHNDRTQAADIRRRLLSGFYDEGKGLSNLSGNRKHLSNADGTFTYPEPKRKRGMPGRR